MRHPWRHGGIKQARAQLTPCMLAAPAPPPRRRCQLGAQRLRAALPDYWPDDAEEPRKPLQGLQICPGSDFKVGGYGAAERTSHQPSLPMPACHGTELSGRAGVWAGCGCATAPAGKPSGNFPHPSAPPLSPLRRRTGAAAAAAWRTGAATRAACGSCSTCSPRACPTRRTAARCGWPPSRALSPRTSSAASAPSTLCGTPAARRRWGWRASATRCCGCGAPTTS